MLGNDETKVKGTSNNNKQSGYNSMSFLEPFQVFCIQKRNEIQKTNPLLSSSDITSLLGKMWRSMDSSHRSPYIEMASQYNKSRKQNDESTLLSTYPLLSSSLSNNFQHNVNTKYSPNIFTSISAPLFKDNHEKSENIKNDQLPNNTGINNTNRAKSSNFNQNPSLTERSHLISPNKSNISPKQTDMNYSNLYIPNLTVVDRNGMSSEIAETSLNLYFSQKEK